MERNKQYEPPVRATRPAITAGFRFISTFGAKKSPMENVTYRAAQVFDTGPKWYVHYSYRHPETGKMQRFKVYEDLNRIKDLKKKKDFAELLKDAVNLALKEGFNPFEIKDIKPSKQWTFNQALNYYSQLIPEMGLRDRTAGDYQSMIKIIQDSRSPMLNHSLKSLEDQQLLDLLAAIGRERKWGNTTYNSVFGRLKTFLFWCVTKKILDKNPLEGKEKKKASPEKNRAYTDAEFKAIYKHITGQLWWFCRFVYHTGTRPIQETRNLTMGMVDFDKKQLAIPGKVSKNKVFDRIPLADEIVEYLLPYKALPADYYIFSKSGEPGPEQVAINYFVKQFAAVKKELGLSEHSGIYSMKATRTVHLAESGIDPYQIMKLWRHSSLEMTILYMRGLGVGIARDAVNVVK